MAQRRADPHVESMFPFNIVSLSSAKSKDKKRIAHGGLLPLLPPPLLQPLLLLSYCY